MGKVNCEKFSSTLEELRVSEIVNFREVWNCRENNLLQTLEIQISFTPDLILDCRRDFLTECHVIS